MLLALLLLLLLLLLNAIISKRILLLRPLDLPRVSVSYVFPSNLSPCALPRSRKHGTRKRFFCCWGSVCGGVDIFFLRFLVCRSPAAWRLFFFCCWGPVRDLGGFFSFSCCVAFVFFFRSRAARRSFFCVLQPLYGNTCFCHFPALRFKAKPFVL